MVWSWCVLSLSILKSSLLNDKNLWSISKGSSDLKVDSPCSMNIQILGMHFVIWWTFENIWELPEELAVLHILWKHDMLAFDRSEARSSSSISSLDTASISSPGSSYSPSVFIRSYLWSTSQWPSPFPILSFSYDVEVAWWEQNTGFVDTLFCLRLCFGHYFLTFTCIPCQCV